MTVRYEAVNAMLLNEFLKEHRKMAEQQSTIAQLKAALAKQQATNAQQQKQIEALAAGLQKVSAAVELNKSSPDSSRREPLSSLDKPDTYRARAPCNAIWYTRAQFSARVRQREITAIQRRTLWLSRCECVG